MNTDDWRLQPFTGRIGRSYRESVPMWRDTPSPPAEAPNIVIVVLDDVGYGQLGCFGSPIDTRTINALASRGLRYSNFHVTALCSPTRASLLTGRNHHSVGMGCLANFDNGFPSGRGEISHSAATISEMLRLHGYNTYAIGKWHVAPTRELSAAGPYDQWPLGRGFDRFYGFLDASTDQWAPELWYDSHRIEPVPREGYHLSADLVDHAVEFLTDHLFAAPDKPFLLYLAFGACHTPHHAPRDAIERYRGVFDDGWDVIRTEILSRQKQLGLVPPTTELPPPNPGVRPWNQLNPQERQLFARMQEVYAGFLDHTDAELERLIAFLDETKCLEDTIVLVLSDNGTSAEGGDFGTPNAYRSYAEVPITFEESVASLDQLGGPSTHPHYPTGWAQAGNTPLRYYKTHTYGGGIRAPFIVHWPKYITEPGGIRSQFHFVADVVPTLLEAVGIQAPSVFAGIPQLPIEGTSMLYSVNDAAAPTRKAVQYFEMLGNRGLWQDGWKAVTEPIPGDDFELDRWRLYHLDEDYSECWDLSDEEPDLLRRLVERWWVEAGKYNVLPLDDRFYDRVDARPSDAEQRSFTFLPGTQALPPEASPDIFDRSFSITAHVERGDEKAEGVLLAQGGRSGFSFFVKGSRLVFDYNLAGKHFVLKSEHPLPLGTVELRLVMRKTGTRSAYGTLLVNGHSSGGRDFETLANRFGTNWLQCGRNSPIAVSDDYEPPFVFSGLLRKVVVELGTDKTSRNSGNFEHAMRQQ